MKFCPTCGAAIDPPDARVCSSCGTDFSTPQPKPLVEKMAIEGCGVTYGATTVRVHNIGTASVTIDHVMFGNTQLPILGIYDGNGSLKNGRVILQPGDIVTVSMQQSPTAMSDNEYALVVVTTSGQSYKTSLIWP